MATHSQFKLYGIYPYDRSAKPRWLLTELGLKFENHWLDSQTREFEQPAYLKLNPMGRIPTVQIDEKPIFESGAICAQITDLFLDKGMAPALTDPARGEYQQWMYFAAATIDPMQNKIMIIEDIPSGEVQKAKEMAIQSELKDALEGLDTVLSKNDFLVRNKFSTADICVGYHLYWLRLWPELEGVMKPFSSITAYLERLKNRPSAVEAKVFSYEP